MGVMESAAGQLRLIGGRLCLDFVNTVGGRKTGQSPKRNPAPSIALVVAEKLVNYDDLLAWAVHAGALSEKESQRLGREGNRRKEEAAVVLRKALELREAMYAIFMSVIAGHRCSQSDLDTVNRELVMARLRERLVGKDGAFAFEWDNPSDELDRMLWPVVHSFAEFLTDGDLARLRQCGGDDCGWLFEDISRNRSRQWCYMQGCGNLSKVRRFRRRMKGAN